MRGKPVQSVGKTLQIDSGEIVEVVLYGIAVTVWSIRDRRRSRYPSETIPMNDKRQQLLDSNQIQSALDVMQAYLAARKNPDGRTPMEVQTERDQERLRLIESELKPLLRD